MDHSLHLPLIYSMCMRYTFLLAFICDRVEIKYTNLAVLDLVILELEG